MNILDHWTHSWFSTNVASRKMDRGIMGHAIGILINCKCNEGNMEEPRNNSFYGGTIYDVTRAQNVKS